MPATAVAPSNFTEARQNLSDALVAVLQAVMAANPNSLRAVYAARPGSFPETPAAFVGDINEVLVFTSGTRQRMFTAEVILVDTLIVNVETANRMDALVDLLVEWFTANVNIITDSGGTHTAPLVQLSGTDGELDLSSSTTTVHYASHTMVFGGPALTFQEGRN